MDILVKLSLISCMVLPLHGASIKSCSDDNECADGDFCYLRTKTCTSCIHCGAYQRRSSGSCVREPSQCGDCLNGFEAEILTDGRTRDLCILKEEPLGPSVQPQVMGLEAGVSWTVLASCAAVLALVGAVVVTSYLKQRMRVQLETSFYNNHDSCTTSSSALFAPSAPPTSHAGIDPIQDVSESRSLQGYLSKNQDEKCQMAGVFQCPVWVRAANNNNDDDNTGNEPQDAVDGPPSNNADQSHLMDENTLPSSWTPGSGYEDDQPAGGSAGPLITSFAGILQLGAQTSAGAQGPTGASRSANHSATGEPNTDQGQPQPLNVTNIMVINNAPSSTTGIINITKI